MSLPFLPTWGVGNYPAGANPWNTTPYSVQPGYSAFTPGVPVAAQEMNYIVGAQNAYAAAAQVSSLSFGGQVAPSTFTTDRSAVYDNFRNLWLLGGTAGGGSSLIANYGNDSASWYFGAITNPGGAGDATVGIGVSPAGSNWIVSMRQAGQMKDWFSANSGLTWTGITTHLATTTTVEWLNFNGVMMAAYGDSGTGAFITSMLTPDATPSFSGSPISGVTAPDWLFRASTAVAVAVPRVTTPSNYWTSANGTSWTTRSFAAGIVNAGDKPVGMAWNATLGLFFLAVSTVAATTRICSSPDGITWTVVKTFTNTGFGFSASYVMTDLNSINGLIVALTDDGLSLPTQSGTGVSRLVFSPDAGVNWYFAPMSMTGGASGTQRPRIHSNGEQLVAFNSVGVRVSDPMGFSIALT